MFIFNYLFYKLHKIRIQSKDNLDDEVQLISTIGLICFMLVPLLQSLWCILVGFLELEPAKNIKYETIAVCVGIGVFLYIYYYRGKRWHKIMAQGVKWDKRHKFIRKIPGLLIFLILTVIGVILLFYSMKYANGTFLPYWRL